MPFLLLFFQILSPPRSTLFPYTTLFRSCRRPPPLSSGAHRPEKGGVLQLLWKGLFRQSQGHCRGAAGVRRRFEAGVADRKSTRLNSSHVSISYAVFCLKKKKEHKR